MPKKKAPETQEVRVPYYHVPEPQASTDVSELLASLLKPEDDKRTMEIGGKTMSLVDFALYVQNIVQKAKRNLTPVEHEILTMFMEIMKRHAIEVSREVFDAYEKKVGGGKYGEPEEGR